MPFQKRSDPSSDNRLLVGLPSPEHQRLLRQLESVTLAKGSVLIDIGAPFGHAYFPTSGLISLMAVTDLDQSLELAMIGGEGFIGLPIALQGVTSPYQVTVQVTGAAWRIRASDLRGELARHGAIEQTLLRYGHDLQREIAQAVVCHRFHSTSQRLSRWLLAAQDRLHSDVIEVTQESLARVLAVPRTAVNAGAVVLQDAGYIRYRHGRIVVTNRERLMRAACDCYRVLRRENQHAHVAH
jgi:CRP-like cAMP-binding protein